MKKIIKISISMFILIGILFIPIHFIYVNAEEDFLKINNNEIAINEKIYLTIDLDKIMYNKFNFKLQSNQPLESIESNQNINIVSANKDEIIFDFDKTKSDLSNIVFIYNLPNNIKAGDSISFVVTLTNEENPVELMSSQKTIIITKANNKTTTVITTIPTTKPITTSKDKNFTINKGTNNFNNKNNINLKPSNNSQISNEKNVETVKYKGDINNYLRSINITGYKLEQKFLKERTTYFLRVGNNVNSIKIKALAESSKSKVTITGNSNFKVGLNKVLIRVQAENGNIKNYRIYVIKESLEKEE